MAIVSNSQKNFQRFQWQQGIYGFHYFKKETSEWPVCFQVEIDEFMIEISPNSSYFYLEAPQE